mmetsp:Transcript_15305/g.44259  ORF Transcript_15305/g.44259 Transcript_15305/m.44259 type:complete len:216 (+) Transcript_15305:980-1627(+)
MRAWSATRRVIPSAPLAKLSVLDVKTNKKRAAMAPPRVELPSVPAVSASPGLLLLHRLLLLDREVLALAVLLQQLQPQHLPHWPQHRLVEASPLAPSRHLPLLALQVEDSVSALRLQTRNQTPLRKRRSVEDSVWRLPCRAATSVQPQPLADFSLAPRYHPASRRRKTRRRSRVRASLLLRPRHQLLSLHPLLQKPRLQLLPSPRPLLPVAHSRR